MFIQWLVTYAFVLFVAGILNDTFEEQVLMDSFKFPPENITFLLYDKFHTSGVELNNTTLISVRVNPSKETVFLVHGWHSDPSTSLFHSIKDAYLKTRDIHVIMVDWRDIATNEYYFARLSIIRVAKKIAKIIRQMIDSVGLDLEKVSFVGHSLGAHVSAVSSRILGAKVQHITGLDPAGPMFLDPNNKLRLRKGDAKFVQVIHTCSLIGYPFEMGDADYWPNGGFCHQPGCSLESTAECSHSRAIEFYRESLLNGNFVARNCENYLVYSSGICNGKEQALMGNHAVDRKHGNFFLTTNEESPYAKG